MKATNSTPDVDITKLKFAEIAALTPVDRYQLMAAGVKLGEKVTNARKAEQKVRPAYAKLVAALKRDHARGQDEKAIPGDVSFRKFFAQNCGGELPGRLESLAALFNTLCLVEVNGKPLLSEPTYDAHSVNSLELANACINHAKEMHGEDWRGCDDTLDVLNALSTAGDATAKLREIRKRQKGETGGDTNESVMLTPETAVNCLLAAIKKAGEMPEEKAAHLFALTIQVGDAWAESGVSDDLLNKWASNVSNGVAPTIEVKVAA